MANIAGLINIASLVLNTKTSSSNSGTGTSATQFSSVLASLGESGVVAQSGSGRVTDAQASADLAGNPSATPQQIYDFMKQSGIDINQLSRVSGKSVSALASTAKSAGITSDMLAQVGYLSSPWTSPVQANQSTSYALIGNATTPSPTGATDDQVRQWLAENQNADVPQIMDAAQRQGITLDQLSRVYGVVPNILIQKAAQDGVDVTAYTNSGLGWKSVAMDTDIFATRLANVGPSQMPGLLQSAGITDAPSMTQMYGQQDGNGVSQSTPEGSIYWANQLLNSLTPAQHRALQDTYYAWANQQTLQNTHGQLSGLFGNEYLSVANVISTA